MSFLAVCGKGLCAFNNSKEQKELMELFCKEKVQIFSNDEKEKAIKFAGINKVFGFLIEQNLLNLKYLEKLKYQGCYAVNISRTYGGSFCVILNDTYYISTNKRIDWQKDKKCFKCGAYYGHEDYFVEDFEQSIIKYATDTMQSIEKATANYIGNFKLLFHHYPWKILVSSDLKQIDDKIEFQMISNTIRRDGEQLELVNKKPNFLITDKEISSISIREIPRRIKNEAIVDVIRNNIWL